MLEQLERCQKALTEFLEAKRSAMPRFYFIGDDDFNKFERDYQSVGYEFSHVINDSWTFRQNLRYDKVDLNYRYLSLRGGNPLTADLQRNAAIENEKLDALAIDNRLETVFDTGALAHQMTIGLDWRYSNADEQRYRSTAPSINYLNPDYDQMIAYPALLRAVSYTHLTLPTICSV